MTVSSERAAAEQADRVRAIYSKLAQIRDLAVLLSSGVSRIDRIMSALRTLDTLYDDAVPIWTALAPVSSPAEDTAIGAVKTKLDDLLIAFADVMSAVTVPVVIDIGTSYNPAGTRAQKLAALNRGFDYKDVSIPAGITAAATALRDAIDAFTAL